MELFAVLDQIVTPAEPRGGDVVAEAVERRWIMPFASGQYVYGPKWTALTRHFQQELLVRAIAMGFEEWLFPRMIPVEAVHNFRLTQFAPDLLLSVDGGREILDPGAVPADLPPALRHPRRHSPTAAADRGNHGRLDLA